MSESAADVLDRGLFTVAKACNSARGFVELTMCNLQRQVKATLIAQGKDIDCSGCSAFDVGPMQLIVTSLSPDGVFTTDVPHCFDQGNPLRIEHPVSFTFANVPPSLAAAGVVEGAIVYVRPDPSNTIKDPKTSFMCQSTKASDLLPLSDAVGTFTCQVSRVKGSGPNSTTVTETLTVVVATTCGMPVTTRMPTVADRPSIWRVAMLKGAQVVEKHGLTKTSRLMFPSGSEPPGVSPDTWYSVALSGSFYYFDLVNTPIGAGAVLPPNAALAVIRCQTGQFNVANEAKKHHLQTDPQARRTNWSSLRADRLLDDSQCGDFAKIFVASHSKKDVNLFDSQENGEFMFLVIQYCMEFRAFSSFCRSDAQQSALQQFAGDAIRDLASSAASCSLGLNGLGHALEQIERTALADEDLAHVQSISGNVEKFLCSIVTILTGLEKAGCVRGEEEARFQDTLRVAQKGLEELVDITGIRILMTPEKAKETKRGGLKHMIDTHELSDSDSHVNPITIPDDCKVLGRILRDLGALNLLQKFTDIGENDSNLEEFHQLKPVKLLRVYDMPEATAILFIERCRNASDIPSSAIAGGGQASASTSTPRSKVGGGAAAASVPWQTVSSPPSFAAASEIYTFHLDRMLQAPEQRMAYAVTGGISEATPSLQLIDTNSTDVTEAVASQVLPHQTPSQSLQGVLDSLTSPDSDDDDLITIPDDCKVLGRILRDLGALHLLPEFVEQEQNDSTFVTLHQLNTRQLFKLYGMPEDTAVQFIEKCRVASAPVDTGHERWLKACLILRACARGVRPFVAAVMEQLHNRVVNEVRETVFEYKSKCDESDWKCEDLSDKDLAFDERPSELQVVALQRDGAATADMPHRLSDKAESFLFSTRNTEGIFSGEGAAGFGFSNLFMRSMPADGLNGSAEWQFVMQNVCKWSRHYLKPFEVRREDGSASFTVVYCHCKVDGAPRLVATATAGAASSAVHEPTVSDAAHSARDVRSKVTSASEGNDDDLHWRFWTIQKKPAKDSFKPQDHNLVSGDIVCFYGNNLPEAIVPGYKYTVLILSASNTKLGKTSFDVCTTLVPLGPFSRSVDAPADTKPVIRVLRPAYPVGMYRDAAYRYHCKGRKSELSQRWDGVNVRQISTDYCEFAKLFCSKTEKELKNYFASDEEGSPELMYNMIVFCKAFYSSATHPLHGFCSFFCEGDEMLKNRLEPVLDGIQSQAAILTKCRNKICHGDFWSFEVDEFESLKESSGQILKHIDQVAYMMNVTDHAHTFERIHEIVSRQLQDIFEDDFTQHPPRVCILNRMIELTFEERQHMNKMIQRFQLEISDLKAQVLSMEQLLFNRLPVCMMQDISKQTVGQSFKAGGQGNVYNVEFWGEQLAAKLFHSGKDAHWKRELNSLTVLLHSNIVQIKYVIYDGVEGKRNQEPRGYVMERMHCSLYDYYKETKLQLEQILALLTQVALALAYTHAKGVAHMDVKPENILLDESKCVAKLCDFGCAHFMQTTLRSTLTPRGSKFFMAPEIIPDDVKSCNPFPVDVFAFGVTMWHLMNPGANCQELTECDWSRSPQIPSAVSELGRRCTNRIPGERPTMQHVYVSMKLQSDPENAFQAVAAAKVTAAKKAEKVLVAAQMKAWADNEDEELRLALLMSMQQDEEQHKAEERRAAEVQSPFTAAPHACSSAIAAYSSFPAAPSPTPAPAPFPDLVAAAAARIKGKPTIIQAAESGDLSLVQDHVTADARSVYRRHENSNF